MPGNGGAAAGCAWPHGSVAVHHGRAGFTKEDRAVLAPEEPVRQESNMFLMKHAKLVVFFCACLGLRSDFQACGATLPDACGSDKIQFNVKTAKDQLAPAPPAAGKAQVVFIEFLDKDACAGCGTPTSRIGMDGRWAGATKGISYFNFDVAPGNHHLCADWQSMSGKFRSSKVAVASFTAEAGKVYYFEVGIKSRLGAVYGPPNGPVTSSPILSLDLKQIELDEGKYRVKISPRATAVPRQ